MWDLNVDGGFGWPVSGDTHRGLTVRVRAGGLVIREPSFVALGFTLAATEHKPLAIGVQSEYLHLWSGLWTQAGLNVDLERAPGFSLAGGWSVAGVELAATRADSAWAWTVFAKVRLPVSILWLAIRDLPAE